MSLDAPSSLALDGAAFSIGIVAARYNPEMVDALVEQVLTRLREAGVHEKVIFLERVPGTHELPFAAQMLARCHPLDVIIALGVVVRGDTIHYELVSQAATQGLVRVALDEGLPVIAGVIAAETQQQAEDRCRGEINRGAEFARAALEMAWLKKKFSR